jgi:hypothetical protein
MSTLGFIFMHIGFVAWFCAGYAIGKNQSFKQPKKD